MYPANQKESGGRNVSYLRLFWVPHIPKLYHHATQGSTLYKTDMRTVSQRLKYVIFKNIPTNKGGQKMTLVRKAHNFSRLRCWAFSYLTRWENIVASLFDPVHLCFVIDLLYLTVGFASSRKFKSQKQKWYQVPSHISAADDSNIQQSRNFQKSAMKIG